MTQTTLIGNTFESAALSYLQSQGLLLIECNFRCKMGEIDIIMRDKATLVFVEVRYRKSIAFLHPADTINYTKQKKIRRTAQFYLSFKAPHYLRQLDCRFDVMAISGATSDIKIEWIAHAF